jgi:hypothetical protein
MNSLEQLVAVLLEQEGFWVRRDVRVDLTDGDKEEIGRRTNAHWPMAIVAYRGCTNELLAVQCKSFFDSSGVRAKAFTGIEADGDLYKLFNQETLRKVVLSRLALQLGRDGFCPEGVRANLALAAGHIYKGDVEVIRQIFEHNTWRLFDPTWLRARLRALTAASYHDSPVSVAVKLLLREE